MMKKWLKFSVVVFGLPALLVSIFVIYKNFVEEPKQKLSVAPPKIEIQGKTATSSVVVEPENEVKILPPPSVGPEIPVNEYWDYAEIQGKHIYVNNTDRNVIYALDKAGKIQWVIWGKDYGFNRFEIRTKNDHFFITKGITNRDGVYETHLWVFGLDGLLRWHESFLRGADIPQMRVTSDNKVIIATGGKKDCGQQCFFYQIQAFDLESGKILWRSSDQLHSHYLDLNSNEKILEASSGGVGMGRFIYKYFLNTDTGLINNFEVKVTDREFSLDNKELVYQSEFDQLVYRTSWTTNTLWLVKAGNPLFGLVKDSPNGQVRVTVLNAIILTQQKIGKVLLLQGFSKNDGQLLWKRELPSAAVDAPISVLGAHDVLVFNIRCSECQLPQEYKDAYKYGYVYTTEVWGVLELTGQTIWKFGVPTANANSLDPITSEIAVSISDGTVSSRQEITLDLLTGKVK